MKLSDWRREKGKTQEWLANELECSQPYISQIERAQNPIIPGPAILERIFMITDGVVEPNDFHDVSRWRRALVAALAALRGKAA